MDRSNLHPDYHPDEPEESKVLNFTPNIRIEGARNKVHSMLRMKTLSMLASTAIVFSVLAVVLAAFAISKYTDAARELKTARENRGKVCLPCDDMTLQLDSWKERNIAGDCCVRLEEMLTMMDEIASQHATEKMREAEDRMSARIASASQSGSGGLQQRVSAHIGLEGDTNEELEWSVDLDSFDHISNGLLLTNSREGWIRVAVAGYYFVYSQLTISFDINDREEIPPTFLHDIYVHETNRPGAVPFVQNQIMRWQPLTADPSYSQQSSFLSGVVYIKSESIIYVNSFTPLDRKGLLGCRRSRCYFGLFKL